MWHQVLHVLLLCLVLEPTSQIDNIRPGASCAAAGTDEPTALLQLGVRVTDRSRVDANVALANARLRSVAKADLHQYRASLGNAAPSQELDLRQYRASLAIAAPTQEFAVYDTSRDKGKDFTGVDKFDDSGNADDEDALGNDNDMSDLAGAIDSLQKWVTDSYVVPNTTQTFGFYEPWEKAPTTNRAPSVRQVGFFDSVVAPCVIATTVIVFVILTFAWCRCITSITREGRQGPTKPKEQAVQSTPAEVSIPDNVARPPIVAYEGHADWRPPMIPMPTNFAATLRNPDPSWLDKSADRAPIWTNPTPAPSTAPIFSPSAQQTLEERATLREST